MTTSQPNLRIAKLQQASREPVIAALSQFAGKPVGNWLPRDNRLATGQFLNANRKTYSTFSTLIRDFSSRNILDVLAATGPNHCIDGWTFLARALSALLAGDAHTARHLSYYAQLRAALSLLNCHGIGIFNGVNFAVDDSRNLHHIDTGSQNNRGLGTHKAAWDALSVWAGYCDANNGFLDSVRFRKASLQDCISAVWPSSPGSPLISEIVNIWGVDLRRSAEEHDSRNVSSYSAHALNSANSPLNDRLELVESIWRSLEPDGNGGFPTLDRHLLRKFLELMEKLQSKICPQTGLWQNAYPKLDPKIKSFMTQDFLERNDQPNDLIVIDLANHSQSGDVHGMVCRALILLRLATVVVHSAFIDAQFDMQGDVHSWFDSVGIDRGFWESGQPPASFDELWDEVYYAVEELYQHITSNPTDQHDFFNSLEMKNQLPLLCQAERACIWGVSV